MPCGRKISSYHYSNHQIADMVRDGCVPYGTAEKMERGECLDDYERRQVEHELSAYHGLHEHIDYDERDCRC